MKFRFQERDFSSSFPSSRKYTIAIGDDDTTSDKVPVFDDGPAEAVCKWRQSFEDLCQAKEFNAEQKFRNARLLLTGDARDKWRSAEEENLGEHNPTDARFRATMNDFMETYVNEQDAEDLREMLMNARKPSDMTLEKFASRWKKLNRYLRYLPGPMGASLDDATKFAVFKKAVPQWKSEFNRSNQSANIDNVNDLISYYANLEAEEERVERRNNRRRGQRQDGRNRPRGRHNDSRRQNRGRNEVHQADQGNSGGERGNRRDNNDNRRGNHNSGQGNGRGNHRNNNNNHNRRYDTNSNSNRDQNRRYNTRYQERQQNRDNEVHHVDERSLSDNNSEAEERSNAGDESSGNETYQVETASSEEQVKEVTDFRPEVVLAIPKHPGSKTMVFRRAVLDSASNKSHGRLKRVPTWIQRLAKTLNNDQPFAGWKGDFSPEKEVEIPFVLTQFAPHRQIKHEFLLTDVEAPHSDAPDFLLGRDFIHAFEIDLLNSSKPPVIVWDDVSVPMVKRGTWTRETIAENFSTMDVSHAFYQVPIIEEAERNFEQRVEVCWRHPTRRPIREQWYLRIWKKTSKLFSTNSCQILNIFSKASLVSCLRNQCI